ncbi:LAETG motif-containing sortase-dependent surface protein [Streptomyces lacrimifluminis]|uniref:LAETG motif-containing sortase-dependent surface protein n=1 Tax=Streptomyces lacrimifluminis TaxID=1500077 RepID=UPI0027E3C3BE|nr:LAETG motif-containing sortase-dependent surface protein [Streptomyces lacrimifluminis]
MSAATGQPSKEASPDLAATGSSSETGIMAATAAALAFIGGAAFFAMKRTRRGTATRQD